MSFITVYRLNKIWLVVLKDHQSEGKGLRRDDDDEDDDEDNDDDGDDGADGAAAAASAAAADDDGMNSPHQVSYVCQRQS